MLQNRLLFAVRDRARLQENRGTLLRFGLTDIVQTLDLSRGRNGSPLQRTLRWMPLPPVALNACAWPIEALGPTFVKLAADSGDRSDLLPAEWTQALEQLQHPGPAAACLGADATPYRSPNWACR